VSGDESIRLFCALCLPAEWTARLVDWQRHLERGDARLVDPANLHVTLAFLGRRPAGDVGPVADALRAAAAAARRPVLDPVRYRETRSVGMLVLDDEKGRAGALASDLHARLEALGVYEPERRRWLPHLTVLRFRTPAGLRPGLPALGPVSPSEAAVYHSVLRPGGAQYEVLESVALGG
jgi:RNA 2',3'-cyclic 3'-phosphodiesterase